jgi:hypothetical protein
MFGKPSFRFVCLFPKTISLERWLWRFGGIGNKKSVYLHWAAKDLVVLGDIEPRMVGSGKSKPRDDPISGALRIVATRPFASQICIPAGLAKYTCPALSSAAAPTVGEEQCARTAKSEMVTTTRGSNIGSSRLPGSFTTSMRRSMQLAKICSISRDCGRHTSMQCIA